MYKILITFPNAFETKRFIEDKVYAKWFERRGIKYNSRHITIKLHTKSMSLIENFIKKFPTTLVVLKEPNKGKFKYTKLSK